MPGLAHLYIGEEAVAVGVCEALDRSDYITSTHRGMDIVWRKAPPRSNVRRTAGQESRVLQGQGWIHAHCRPGDRQSGRECNRLRQRWHRYRRGIFRQAIRQRRVAVCFFGEGALGQGVLYEEMNLAQLFKLPVIYVCENNLYTEYTHYTERPRRYF